MSEQAAIQQKQNEKFSIGADPEFFLVDPAGAYKSAIPYISGTKHDQLLVKGGGLQRDNVAAEFSCEPSFDEAGFVASIGNMLRQLAACVKPLRLRASSSTLFPETELDHPEARQFGCDPDFNGYTVSINEVPPDAADGNLRSCGGHIHIGYSGEYPAVLAKDDTGYGRIRLVKAMDLFVGIPSLLLDLDEGAALRRSLYGKAGCHRPKPYGVEYRTVSNFWTRSPGLTKLVYRLSAMAVAATENGLDQTYLAALGEDELQRIINEADTKEAKRVVKTLIFPHMKPETVEVFEKALVGPGELYNEWEI